ncbi:MAG: DUF4135 domain-containing protein, partial [Alphaproteobacteria bacterium]|nr:DUF4135 domain-containing protein [Alphaproteobacteria bacterium]
WHEYIPHKKYTEKENLKLFYKNTGALLAICDSLNYTDGHSENFVCSENKKLVLIDSETIFTNLSYFQEIKLDFFFDLEFTGMIQNLEGKTESGSALQDFNVYSHYPINPHVINDCTSNMEIRYKATKINSEKKSCPSIQKINLNEFTPDIISGLKKAYKQINEKSSKLNKLVLKYTNLKTRQIKRHTLYYHWLLHRSLHPLTHNPVSCIDEHLNFYNRELTDYEKESLLNGDIPVCYHALKTNDLLGIESNIISKGYSSKNSFEWYIEKQNKLLYNKSFINKREDEVKRLLCS